VRELVNGYGSGVFHVAAAIGMPAQTNDFHSCPNLFAMGAAVFRIPGRNASTGRVAALLGVRHISPSSMGSDVMPPGNTTKLDAELRQKGSGGTGFIGTLRICVLALKGPVTLH
jgi:hypothetical protein